MQSSMGTLPNGESIFAPDSKPLYLQGVHELYTELKESEKKRGEKALQITRLQEKLSRCEEELGEFEAHLQRVRTEGAAAGLMAAPEKVPVQRRRNSFGSAVTRSAAAVSAVTRSASAATRSLSFTPRPKVGVSVGTPPPAAPRASSSAPGRGVFYPAHSPAALRAGEPAARPAVQRFFDSPAALRAAAASTMQAGAHALLWQQQLDAVSKGRQELRDQLNREQERSRELESANAQFFSANARDAKSIDRLRNERNALQVQCNELESANAQFNECTSRLRNERNALQAQCNELKKERAPAVVPLGVNNGRVSSFFRR